MKKKRNRREVVFVRIIIERGLMFNIILFVA